ncbi:MAG: hypothetical protein QOH95_1317, partial [Gaiellaceae bacterium]|nr:hypothetical protein [Gaiellaceae bacterium]
MLRAPGMRLGLAGLARTVAWLPRGDTLPAETWRQRHTGLRYLLWAQLPALVGLEAVLGRQGRYPVALLLVPVAVLGAVGGWKLVQPRLQSVAVTL